ncbi:MAG TPA: GNAT family N-acetyltransferase [Pyrinomonadaceae bacterium]|jgi:hypothetical protein|nr:GNAT family N-acetyltransferase [Pyrinomonadaceae bacterium]
MSIYLRNFTEADLDEIVHLERTAWPEDVRASRAKLRDRLQTFPEGFFGIYETDLLVGMASCQVVTFSQRNPLQSWDTITANGWISKTHDLEGNCLHFVSICVLPDRRHFGTATRLNQARLSLAEKIGLKWALTDTRLPGLRHYLNGLQSKTPNEYVEEIISGVVAEPVVRMYLNLGFQALGLIPDCMASDLESANYGLAMAKKIGQ